MSTDIIRALGEQLEIQRPGFDKLDTYLENEPIGPLGFIAPEVREQVGSRLAPVIVNYARLVLAAIEERLDVTGFRLGADASADAGLWSIWQANNMDLGSQQAHLESLLYGRAPVICWRGDDAPRITPESARQVVVTYQPGTRQATAALKLWVEDEHARAVTFTPTEIRSYRSQPKVIDATGIVPAHAWLADGPAQPNRLGLVPVVELRNRSRLVGGPESELVDVLPIVDAIAKLLTDLMVSAEYAAMPRRYVVGMALPEDPDTGEPDTTAAFSLSAMRTWFLEGGDGGQDVKVGQFPEATLGGFVAGVELLTQQLATVTGLPPHYLNSLTGQLPSAESLKSAEASLVARVRRKMTAFGDAWEQVARLAWLVRDGRLPDGAAELETVWRDPESRTDAMAADAALKRSQLGVPWAQLMADLGYTPSQIDAMRAMKRTDAIDAQGVDLTLLRNPGAGNAA